MSLLRLSDGTPVSTLDVDAIAMSGYRYSTDEICVGCWTDGRPIYRKTYITGTNLTFGSVVANSKRYNTSATISDLSVDKLLNIKGELKASSTSGYTDYYEIGSSAFAGDLSNQIATLIFQKDTSITITRSGISTFVNIPAEGYIVIDYTKTTDSENSFTLDMLYHDTPVLPAGAVQYGESNVADELDSVNTQLLNTTNVKNFAYYHGAISTSGSYTWTLPKGTWLMFVGATYSATKTWLHSGVGDVLANENSGSSLTVIKTVEEDTTYKVWADANTSNARLYVSGIRIG